MNEDLTAFCRRLLENVQSDTTDLVDEVHFEPAASFTDVERFNLERERYFLRTPQVVGFAGELAESGSLKTAAILDRPIVLTRTESGELRAFLNVCQHRGATLQVSTTGRNSLICPFHGWRYELDGRLSGRPKDGAFIGSDADTTQLVPLAVSDRGGLLTVAACPSVTQSEVDNFLDGIATELQSFDFSSMKFIDERRFEAKANWKLVVNLSNEGYHFKQLHKTSLAPMMSGHGVVDLCGPHSRWGFALNSITELAELAESDWPAHFPGSVNHTLFPGTVIVATPGSAQLIRTEPGDTPGESVVYYHSVWQDDERSSDAERRAIIKAMTESFEFGEQIFAGEDLPAAELCQRGIEAGGIDPLVCGKNEPLLSFWHKQWTARLQ